MSDTYRHDPDANYTKRDRKKLARIHSLRNARRNDKRGWMKYNQPKTDGPPDNRKDRAA